MLQTVPMQSITNEYLTSLYQIMLEHGDTENAAKLLDVYEKNNNQEIMISFAGHFSAGKSSMINELLGKQILPKSPIPTSANVVKIKSGYGTATVYFHDNEPLEYEEPYDIDMIKEYAKDKAGIKAIDISTKEAILPSDCIIVDTPGIDAADDADRLMTESSLHLVDRLFYVMDYNHVQSEVNLQFLKMVQDFEIPFYIIINQIDKHDEREITFDSFTESINQTFSQWDINPEKIYYSSLIDSAADHNQINNIREKLTALMTDKEAIMNIERSTKQVMEAHRKFLHDVYEEKLPENLSEDGEMDAGSRLEAVKERIESIKHYPQKVEEAFLAELNKTLKNAYLMPAVLRDKAQVYLESQQQDFKAGIFSSKKKTQEEREKRLDDFYQSLKETMETSIQWKLRDKFSELLKEFHIYDQQLANAIQQLAIDYGEEQLRSLQKPGAKVNGDYVLIYTNDVSSDIKQRYKREAFRIWEQIQVNLDDQVNEELKKYEPEKQKLQDKLELHRNQMDLKNELQEKLSLLESAYSNPKSDVAVDGEIEQELKIRHKPVKKATKSMYSDVKQVEETVAATVKPEKKTNSSVENTLEKIENVIDTIQDLPGFQSIIDDLSEKRHRLTKRSFTIALFGAFSAGKSSFANALLGKNVLPVSPNPTTAVINRINPVEKEVDHGTVVVTLKDTETLINDLKQLMKKLDPPSADFEQLVDWIRKNNIHEHDDLHQTHQNYLQAILDGYHDYMEATTGSITIDIDSFEAFVTNEAKACYIESVDLYYDCELTRDGITLVDTPGADSVNARHTNVAFDYIKHADAILYVTYYNHALARADKDFLLQLGRVKDAFELDKMFFIMNAADLAADDMELNLVSNYIKEQLTILGIRFPRLYPISSKQSLMDKQKNFPLNEQMAAFQADFNHFIHHELAAITIQSAGRDMYRALQAIRQYLDSLQLNEAEKDAYRNELQSKREALKEIAANIDSATGEQKIAQKIEKQLYYVLERLSIRFHDFFKETFNPATITESGRKAVLQLEKQLQELLDYTGYELLQELRAVSLRIEAFMKELQTELQDDFSNSSKQIDPKFLLPDITDLELQTPEYEQAFIELGTDNFRKELKLFNGTKAFFAKNEKETMKEAIYSRISPVTERYLEKNQQHMQDSYLEQWQTATGDIKQDISKHIDLYIDNLLSMMDDHSVEPGVLQAKQDKLVSILDEEDWEA
ncbi:dynamin family protein [Virgibacillus ihumii]|uniref:dynamin family protein n=1 Tax=Virgibacillus ihumii TaxID=2686091 RepID=UPI00157C8424|nr:dynamin family protein [Virgibacillus ihumii]